MEQPPNIFEGGKSKESPEKGANVELLLKIIRHGERTKEGELTDYGREVTRERAQESGISAEDFDAIKPIGSNVDPDPETGKGRSLESSEIYARKIAGEKVFTTRPRNIFSYETLKTKPPYDHREVYNANLPDNFDSLSDEDKVEAAKVAQDAVMNHVFSLKTPEAEAFMKEVAGAFAHAVEHYSRMAKRLKSGSKVLMIPGSHGGTMEYLLKEALIRKNEKGEDITGFEHIGEIGGGFNPSEAYNVFIKTDGEGNLEDFVITFDSSDRPQGEMHLDPKIVHELAEYYKELHKDDEEFRQKFKTS